MPTVCNHCKKCFSTFSNLRAHVKRKHPDKLDVLCPIKHHQSVASCNECSQTFAHKRNLSTHMKNKHPGKLKPEKTLKCTLCHHNANKGKLINHYQVVHNIQIATENMEFCSFEEFQAWKLNIEKETVSSFVKMHGSYKSEDYTKIRYSCHRSGQVRSRGKGTRRVKTQGSNKIGGFCPASMDIQIKKGKCEVAFIKTHVGHKQELGHLFLSDLERRKLAAKIARKIPLPTILDEIRDSVSNCNLERLHLLKKKDLYNIKQSFKLNNSSVGHRNDAISVESWVKEMEGNSNSETNNLIVDIHPNEVESIKIVKTISQPVKLTDCAKTLAEEKEKLLGEVVLKLNSISSFDELNAVKKIIAPIGPTLDALRCNLKTVPSIGSQIPHNKKITPRRSFFCTKKVRKSKKEKLPKSSAAEAVIITRSNEF